MKGAKLFGLMAIAVVAMLVCAGCALVFVANNIELVFGAMALWIMYAAGTKFDEIRGFKKREPVRP